MTDALDLRRLTDITVGAMMGATVTDHGDFTVVRTDSNPLYHWGNYIQVNRGNPSAADHWLALFAAEFPNAKHRAFGLPGKPAPSRWAANGLDLEVEVTLTSEVPLVTPSAPAEYTCRPLVGDADWQAQVEQHLRESPVGVGFAEFARTSAAARRRLCESGAATWYGAFTPAGELVSTLGVVVFGDIARFQHVGTDTPHRRRGLAGYLLTLAGAWAQDQGARTLVIVTDNPDAQRLYEHVGFAPVAQSYGAYAPVWPVPQP